MVPRFLRRWILAVILGETVGFTVPALTGGVLAALGAPAGLVYAAMILAGACEGALLGFGQSIGFGRGAVPRTAWIAATSGGAAIAWSIGMLPSTLGGIDFGSPLAPVVVGVGGLVLLLSIPTAQWLVIRNSANPSEPSARLPPHSTLRWIPVNASAWAVGLCWTLVPSPFIDERTPAGVILAVYIVAGLLMAATVATLTGPAALRIARSRTPERTTEHTPEYAAPLAG